MKNFHSTPPLQLADMKIESKFKWELLRWKWVVGLGVWVWVNEKWKKVFHQIQYHYVNRFRQFETIFVDKSSSKVSRWMRENDSSESRVEASMTTTHHHTTVSCIHSTSSSEKILSCFAFLFFLLTATAEGEFPSRRLIVVNCSRSTNSSKIKY